MEFGHQTFFMSFKNKFIKIADIAFMIKIWPILIFEKSKQIGVSAKQRNHSAQTMERTKS